MGRGGWTRVRHRTEWAAAAGLASAAAGAEIFEAHATFRAACARTFAARGLGAHTDFLATARWPKRRVLLVVVVVVVVTTITISITVIIVIIIIITIIILIIIIIIIAIAITITIIITITTAISIIIWLL